MKKLFITLLFCAGLATIGALNQVFAQEKPANPIATTYQETPAKINNLVHTKLAVSFDYKKRYLYGKEWLTLKPHFYPTDTLRLDAKGMDLKDISVVKNGKNYPLKFSYDSLTVAIKLDKVYHSNESYTLYIDYTAKPNELKTSRKHGKGLYFINPDGTEKNKPTQIWTEGEPESSSAWFPTIDKPNQKTTAEIIMTVPAKYVTLSNGRLASQKVNADKTRTDTWKMELPNAPYLFMMAVGDFAIYKDSWRGKEVSYYVEPKYASYAKDIFGFTPDAMSFFSKITGVDYPWNKYAQITVRDYVSGAMENTTAMMTGEGAQATKRELVDRIHNDFGSIHELFHQWFGDYVTTESWSNLTLNESFADLGEILWAEYRYDQDAADEHIQEGLQGYLGSTQNATKSLVRFYYNDSQDVFDGVTYQKGGRILNMLRHYLGNEAFYKGLNIYLTTNAFKNAEAQQLRLAMEEASGLDLNWFFNQWYYGAGHPELNISYSWDESSKKQTIYLQQTQSGQVFTLPFAVDIYVAGKKERHPVWMRSKADTLTFTLPSKPDLVNVDGDKLLLAKKTDHKTLEEYAFQYAQAPLYLDRYEAIEAATSSQKTLLGQKILLGALKDKYFGLRLKALRALNMDNDTIRTAAYPSIVDIAQKDDNPLAQAQAIVLLGKYKKTTDLELLKQALKSQSYAVQGAALWAINQINPTEALALAPLYEKDNKGDLTNALFTVYTGNAGDDKWDYIFSFYMSRFQESRYKLTDKFATYIGRIKSQEHALQGIAEIKKLGVQFKKYIGPQIIAVLTRLKTQRAGLNDTSSASAIDDAIAGVNKAK
ncbi:M1 family metallopeptidase [Mucilaginibacter ginsenosidivorax]|uniref:Aminopeptidase N n=1 Tax=Mucilaginibacter ginsenosidivorax TaxID=862126 RepID=A0A5B8VX22_9SPHI|nr:M1 family metallopeptidase [Mucilaginibacter ginsenosidivorax]QEC75741.1 M1 family metallopeptidase [Mucilaginibacter ginsenosidivorax]